MNTRFKPNYLALCLASLFASYAHAESITINGRYNLGSSADVGTVTPPDLPNTSASGYDHYLNEYSGGSNIFFHTYGYTGSTTYFGARASGDGTYFGSTSAAYSNVLYNNTGVAQNVLFSFYVENGEVGVYDYSGSGSGSARLSIDVRRDGASVTKSLTEVIMSAGSVSCSETSSGALAGYSECASPTASHVYNNGQTFTVDLGLLDPYSSLQLDYDIIATVAGDFAVTGSTDCYGGGYGEIPVDPYGGQLNEFVPMAVEGPGECGGYSTGGSIARAGDPFGGGSTDTSSNFSVAMVPTNNVPEPGSLALAGVALAGAASVARRRKAKPDSV